MALVIKRGTKFCDVDLKTRMIWLHSNNFYSDKKYWLLDVLDIVNADTLEYNLLSLLEYMVDLDERPSKSTMIKLARTVHYLHESDEFHNIMNSKHHSTDFIGRYGSISGKIYEQSNKSKLKTRPKPKVVSVYQIKYWKDKGYSDDDATIKISELQKSNANNRKDFKMSDKVKQCTEYWLNLGYSVEESEIKRNEYINSTMTNDLLGMIKRHGDKEGTKKYNERCENYRLGIEKIGGYGSFMVGMSRASKDSLKVFEPLFLLLKKLDLFDDLYIGLPNINKKEWFINSGKGIKFYDFTIPSIKLIIEFNGCAWHPRIDEPNKYRGDRFKNPISFDDALNKDKIKLDIAKRNGFDVLYVWDDSPVDENIKICEEFINARYQSRNR